MREVKRLVDPRGLLNPGVLLTDDPQAHLRHIKLAPTGRGRGRQVRRVRLLRAGVPVARPDLDPAAAHRAAPRDPVRRARRGHRDRRATRARVRLRRRRDLRRRRHVRHRVPGADRHRRTGQAAARARTCRRRGRRRGPRRPALGGDHRRGRGALDRDDALPAPLEPVLRGAEPGGAGRAGRRHRAAVVGRAAPAAARPGDARHPTACRRPCTCPRASTRCSAPRQGPGVQASVEALCAAAGITLLVPDGIDALCCGTPWSSKGIAARPRAMRAAVAAGDPGGDRRRAAAGGVRRVVVHRGASGDLLGPRPRPHRGGRRRDVRRRARAAGPGETGRLGSLTLHPTCSSTQLGLNADLVTRGRGRSPTTSTCRSTGAAALRRRPRHAAPGADGLGDPARGGRGGARSARDAHASCNRTCELGMTRATGEPYRHVLELLAEQALHDSPPNGPNTSSKGAPR